MRNQKARRRLLLILIAVFMLSGCANKSAYILPSDSTGDTVPATNAPTTVATTAAATEPQSTEHQHSYTETVTDPTCTGTGFTTYTCDCGHSFTDNQTEALGHNYIISIVDPTTEAQGYDLHQCSRCNDSYQDNYTDKLIPASHDHTHSYTDKVVSPTCTEKGYTKHSCSCGDSYTDSHTDPLGHDFKVTTVDPTTNSKGYDLHQCRRCNYSYKDNYTDKLPAPTEPPATSPTEPKPTEHTHSYTKSVVDPTCTEKGYTKHSCSCGDSYTDSHTDPLGHDFKVTTVDPTTNSKGYDLHQCRRCNYSYKDNYTDKLPAPTEPPATSPTEPKPTEHTHSYTKSVVDPTCTEKGYTLHTCSCGDSYKNTYTDPLGHDYKVSIVLPTTEEKGYNFHTCTRCGDSYKDNYVDKLPAHTDPPETEPPATEPPKYDHPVYDISDHTVGALEYEILAQINAQRTAAGMSELKMDKKLAALATIRAYECTISFSHTRPNGSSCFSLLAEYNYSGGSLAGENLLYASTGYTAAQLVDVWMGSTGHKNNILSSSFTKAGIGIFYSGGRIYVANYFSG